MSPRYEVYADTKYHSSYQGLIGACAVARCAAIDHPGVDFVVEREGVEVANYKMEGGKLAAWMA